MNEINDLTLNRLLISPKQVIEPYCGGFNVYWEPLDSIDLFLADSANNIFISKWEADFFKIFPHTMPKIFENRIIIIDEKNKILNKIIKIIREIDDSITRTDPAQNNSMKNFHLGNVFKFLYNFHLGIEYKCDIDCSPYTSRLDESLDFLINRCEKRDIIVYLKQINRFWKTFSLAELNYPIYKPVEKSAIIAKQIIEDSNFITISSERFNLALNWDTNLLSECNLKVQRFAKKHPQLMRIGKLPITLLPTEGKNFLEEFSLLFGGVPVFCPSIIDTELVIFNSMKKTLLSEDYSQNTLNREWNWKTIENKWFDNSGLTVAPLDIYSLSGYPSRPRD